jgi:hypothetical protein
VSHSLGVRPKRVRDGGVVIRKSLRRLELLTSAIVVALALTPLAAAQTSGAVQAALADPCSLISLQEVQALIGNPPMLPATPNVSADLQVASCQYANDYPLTADPKTKHTIVVTIYSAPIAVLKGGMLWPDQNPAGDHQLTDQGTQQVTSLGAEAYCNPRPDTLGDKAGLMVAIVGDHTLDVTEQSGVMSCDQVAQLAQVALSRLNSGSLAASPTPPPVSPDRLTNALAYPCSIVTVDEAAAIFGGTMETSLPPIGQPQNPFCTWHNGTVTIIGQIYSDPVDTGEKEIGTFQTLTGPGGVAADCSTPAPGQFILITAIDTNHYLSVVAAVPGPATCDQAFQFALKALPRL